MPDPKLKHSGYIDWDQFGDPFTAKCCCDWQGPTRLMQYEAEADLAKHLAEVA